MRAARVVSWVQPASLPGGSSRAPSGSSVEGASGQGSHGFEPRRSGWNAFLMAGPRRALISSVVGGSHGAGGAAVSASACCSRASRCLSTTSMRWSASARRAISSGVGGSSRSASWAILSSNSDRTLSTARRVVCLLLRGSRLSAQSAAWSPTSRCMSTRPRMLAVRRSSMEPELFPPPCWMLAAIASTAAPSSISAAPASRPAHCVLSRSMPRSCRTLHTLCTAP